MWKKKRNLQTPKETNITDWYDAVIEALSLIPSTHTSVAADKVIHFTEWKDRWDRLYFREVTAQTPHSAHRRSSPRKPNAEKRYLYDT